LNRRDPKPLRGGAIAGLHLGCGQDVHRIHGTREFGGAGLGWGPKGERLAALYLINRACRVVRELTRVRMQVPFFSQRK
jgi:hypothetical protein